MSCRWRPAEITTKYAKAYVKAGKKDKGRVLDQVVAVTGWSRDNARRRLAAAASRPPGAGRKVAAAPRKPRADKFSYDARLVLQRVRAASGGQCGKYLAASMRLQLDALERHGELVDGSGRYSASVRAELLAMSAASIDRYLQYYDLGHGFCNCTFFEQCPHRMACAKCDFYTPKDSSKALLLEAKTNLQRMLAAVPLTDDERAAVDDGQSALDKLLDQLADVPTPSGPTPRQIGVPADATLLPIVDVRQGPRGAELPRASP